MSQDKVKIKYKNALVDAVPVAVTESTENWNIYKLEDKSVVKMKLVVTDVFRIEGQYDAEGNPVYMIKSSNIPSITAPDDLKKKG